MEKSTFQCDGEGFSSRVYFPDGDARGTVLMCHAWAGQSHFERARHGKAQHAGQNRYQLSRYFCAIGAGFNLSRLKVLALHGSEDPMATAENMVDFAHEMTVAQVSNVAVICAVSGGVCVSVAALQRRYSIRPKVR